MKHNALPIFDEKWKAKCKTCRHLDSSHPDGAEVMRCSVVRKPSKKTPMYCIDARDPGGECGPSARRWQASH